MSHAVTLAAVLSLQVPSLWTAILLGTVALSLWPAAAVSAPGLPPLSAVLPGKLLTVATCQSAADSLTLFVHWSSFSLVELWQS